MGLIQYRDRSAVVTDNAMTGVNKGVRLFMAHNSIMEGTRIGVVYHNSWPNDFMESWDITLGNCSRAFSASGE